MVHRTDRLLKIVCAVLALLVLQRAVRTATHLRPLGSVTIPDVPVWTNAPPASGGSSPGGAAPGVVPVQPSAGPGAPPGRPPRVGRGGRGGPATAANLPEEIRADGEKIIQSGLLGPVVRPPPMALLGIAGGDVFLRAPNGQTGLVREGEELGGVRIVRIGTNRVVVLEDGEEKELSIFEGLGSESLLTPGKPPTP